MIGGEFQIDDAGVSANKGCIRYNSAATKLQFSHDCSTYLDFSTGSSSLWTETTGGIHYNSGTHYVGIGLTNPDVELDVDGSIEFTGSITDVSDRRKKKDIKRLPEDTSQNMHELIPVSFKMKDGDGKTEYGFIAQDVEDVFPALVHTKNGGVKSLNYLGLIAPMVSAIQDLQDKNAMLREQNAEFVKRFEALETVLSDKR